MIEHTKPTIAGMGAYEGGQLPGALVRANAIRNARAALASLKDADFADAVVQAIRNRSAVLAERIIDRVTK